MYLLGRRSLVGARGLGVSVQGSNFEVYCFGIGWFSLPFEHWVVAQLVREVFALDYEVDAAVAKCFQYE